MTDQIYLLKRLCQAIKSANLSLVKECLKDKPPLNLFIDDDEYLTPWHWAHSYGTYEVIKALLEAGADPNVRLEYLGYETVLFGVVAKGDSVTASLLVRNGANINAVETHGLTPLHFAISRSSSKKEMIVDLLMLEADITKGQDIVQWMRTDYPDYEYDFYEAYDEFLDQSEALNPRLYQDNIDRLKELCKKYSDLPDYLQERTLQSRRCILGIPL